ncbi:MAG: hypothetical protein CVT72_16585 [Alphaproteobacteria bacterium HGW-Alphaproteobacteria-11]|nr:MAG: hypothetical protein CVT72_16585 [Alphaproteobacteria bacterium HGW-Alphaproteobacteria-11]
MALAAENASSEFLAGPKKVEVVREVSAAAHSGIASGDRPAGGNGFPPQDVMGFPPQDLIGFPLWGETGFPPQDLIGFPLWGKRGFLRRI